MSKKTTEVKQKLSQQELLDLARSLYSPKEWEEFSKSKEDVFIPEPNPEPVSIKDELAIKILGEIWRYERKISSSDIDGDVDFAYRTADAMLKARQF